VGSTYWPCNSETKFKLLKVYRDLIKYVPRKCMKKVWKTIFSLAGCGFSLSSIARLEAKFPKIKRREAKGKLKGFTVVSISNVIQQVVATKRQRDSMYDLPILSKHISEYSHCKRFWDLHKELKVASVQVQDQRCFIEDFVSYNINNEIHYGLCTLLFIEGTETFNEIYRMIRYC
jgi:hypothetical protein